MTGNDVNEPLLRTSAGKSSEAGLYWIANLRGIVGANGNFDLGAGPGVYFTRWLVTLHFSSVTDKNTSDPFH